MKENEKSPGIGAFSLSTNDVTLSPWNGFHCSRLAAVMSDHVIRVIALAIILHPATGRLLVFRGYDASRALVYHRPFGGGVEAGETAAEAAVREIREEIGVIVDPIRTLGFAESFFVAGGLPRHEIALLVECRFTDQSLYDRNTYDDIEGNGEHGLWRDLQEETPLFPETLLSILRA